MSLNLILDKLHAGYGSSTVIQDISLTIDAGSSLAILGRNGAGKSTLLATLAGAAQLHSGRIILNSRNLSRTPSHQRARLGLAWVPQERAVFSSLTVNENLSVVARPGDWNAERVYHCFPRLAERRHNLGGALSGGEQQMLAIGRALMLNPALLLLDEPLEGLAPMVADDLLQTLTALMHDHAMMVIIVEQHPGQILPVTDHAIILERGRIVHRATSQDLLADTRTLEQRLGIEAG